MQKILLSVFVFTGLLTNAQTYFEENFDGANLTTNNNWLVFDVQPSTSELSWRLNLFENNGRALVSNYNDDNNEALETWLISSAVTLSGASSPVITFDNTKRFNGDNIALLISTEYDGTSNPTGFDWQDFTSQANFDSNTGNWDMVSSNAIDLSDFNGQTIYFAYKYVGSESNGSTYQIDNIKIEEGQPSVDFCDGAVFCDDFNGGSLTANNAWQVFDVNPVNSGNEFLKWRHRVFNDDQFATVSNYNNELDTNEVLESWLITPTINLSNVTNPFFGFDHTKRRSGDDLKVLISTDYDGTSNPTTATWDNITNLLNMDQNEGAWTYVSTGFADLSAYSGETNIYIAFQYNGSNTDGSTYQVDNVLLNDGEPDETPPCSIGIFCDDFNGGSLTANNAWEVVDVVPVSSGNDFLRWRHRIFDEDQNVTVSNYNNNTSSNEELESWLISPAVDMTNNSGDIVMNFIHTKRFQGDDLALQVSLNYTPSSDPTTANWTDISDRVNWNTNIDSWFMTSSGNIDLSDFAGEVIYFSFKYNGSNTDGSTYRVDDILIQEFEAIDLISIYDIQFTEDASGDSPLVGQEVRTSGVVTATSDNTYFIQDGEGAWNGIEVFQQNHTMNLGDLVEVQGTVEEFNSITQLTNIVDIKLISSDNDLPNPIVVSTGNVGHEMYESVLVKMVDAVCTNASAGFGQWEINDGSGIILVNPKLFDYTPNQGQTYNVTGLGYFSFSEYKLLPRFLADIDDQSNVTENKFSTLSLYPNPANEYVHLKDWPAGNVQIVDVLGNIIYSNEISGANTHKINITKLNKGIYFVRQGEISVKLVVQ